MAETVPRRRLRRILRIALVVLVVVPILVGLGIWAALQASGVRRAILGRISSMLATEYGLAFTAGDFAPSWWLGAVELRDVRVGAPGAAPLVIAERVGVQIDLGTLRKQPLVVRSVTVDGARVDLRAPFPQIPEQPSEAGTGPPVEIQKIEIRRGEVIGAPLEGAAAEWVRSWSAREIAARGSYRGGRLDLEVTQAKATVDRPGYGRQELQAEARVGYAENEPLRVHRLRVTGEGLRAMASGAVGLAPGQRTDLQFDLYAQPKALVAGVPPRGELRAVGRVALPENSAKVALKATEIPAEALKPYLDPKLYGDLALPGTSADVQADAIAGPGSWEKVAGTAKVAWRRGRRGLAQVEAHVAPGAEGEPPIVLTAVGNLLPGSPGRRAFQGTLKAASWAEMAKASLEGARAELKVPDVRAAFAEVRSLWPRLIPALPPEVPLQGSLTADVRLSGPLDSPRAKAAATWLPRAGSLVRIDAEGLPRTWTGTAKVRTEALPLEMASAFAPGLSGTLTATVDLSGSPRGYKTRVEAQPAGLAYPPALERLESGTVTADGTLVIQPFSFRGTVTANGVGLVASPNASDTARLASFQLAADGRLQAEPLRWDGRLTLDGEGGEMAGTGRLARFHVDSDGLFRGEPLSYQGKVTITGEDGEATGVARVARFEALTDGLLTVEPLLYDGTVTLEGTGVEAPGTTKVDRLKVAAQGKAGADLKSLAAKARVDADRVVLIQEGEEGAQETEVRNVVLDAEGDGREVRIATVSGELSEGRTFTASGRVATQPLLSEADLDVRLVRPVDAIPMATFTARLREGILNVEAPGIDTATGPVSLTARVPLGALRGVPQLAGVLKDLPLEMTPGPVSLSLEAPALDSEPLLAALGMEPRPERIRTGVSADLTLDLAAPAAGQGEIRLTGLSAETPDGKVTAEGAAVLRLAGGKLDLLPVHLRIDGGEIQGAGIDLRGTADLARSWKPFEQPLTAAVTRVSAEAGGTLDAALLNPFLQGGAGSGALTFSAHAEGPPDRLAAEARLNGPGASLFFPAAAARIQDPQVALQLRDGRWTIEEGRTRVNGGTVDFKGGGALAEGLAVQATVKSVPYRLDYGVDLLLSGQVNLNVPAEGRPRVTGTVVVDRGVLNRDLNLDREVLFLLFAPDDTPGTEESVLSTLDLDVKVETVNGVRVKNNVGDLRVSWQRLEVKGTPEEPVIRGRIDIDPGGLFYAYGQTVRIDRGSITFRGDPVTDPEIDLTTTNSLQDPKIALLQGESPLDLLAEEGGNTGEEDEGPDTQEVLAGGLASYYGTRLSERLGGVLGLSSFTVGRRVLVFSETDPSARLTIGRDLSRNVALALSVDLRNAERQTYLLYVDDLSLLPGLRAEGFVNDQNEEGGSLQQVLDFGGEVLRGEAGPHLRRLRVSVSGKGVSRRKVRQALRLEKGEPVPEGSAFTIEVDVADLLRRKGYPAPRISVAVTPVEGQTGRVDVAVNVEPGPKVSFIFEGDRPPRALRPGITSLYRTDFYEPNSIEDMRKEAVRAFRSTGHLRPRVEIEVRRERPEDPDGPRTVSVRTEAGRRVKLDDLMIAGLDPEESRLAARFFPGTLSRTELATGVADADRRLLRALSTLGYPEASIISRFVKADGSRLVVTVEPGPRPMIASLQVAGVEGEERDRLLGILKVHPGQPVRPDLLSQDVLRLEKDLRDRGYADAAVLRSVNPLSGRPGEAEVVFQVAPGIPYRIAGVDVEAGRFSRPAPFRREAGLDIGDPFSEVAIEEARNRLFSTGVFNRVEARVDKEDDGEARVTFSLSEQPRFRLGYGVRWESEEGTAGVLDFVDQNFLGRGVTLGLRGLYQSDIRSGRLYLRTGGILGTDISLESYAEVQRQTFDQVIDEDIVLEDNQVEDRLEIALQVGRPFGKAGTGRLYARYRTTHNYDIEPDPFSPIPFDERSRLPLLGGQYLHDTRDDRIDPRTGLFASADFSGTGAFLGSDLGFLRLFTQAASFKHVSLAGRTWTWAQSVRLGLAHPLAGQEVIRDERFFAGGPYSVRGYEQDSLGPQEDLIVFVRPLRGEALFVINEEMRVPLPWDLTGLVFFDAGQVWRKPADIDLDLAKALGLGLRARTPLGLLRLDAAYPLDRRPGDARYKLYVGFGNAF